ncbi:signal peptide peptidase SppA [Benzoatithermus flavus]|uniref:Signal peptide peptidase SppA n=1 Tax=Benzoatithermus flavus TaxID=3108223 RepID=A0ABU8XN99_9PROT
MRRFLVGVLAAIGVVTLVIVGLVGALVWRFLPERHAFPAQFVLTADWSQALAETAGPPDLLDFRLTPAPTVSDIVLALDAATRDPRVKGLVVRLAEARHGFAAAQELRDAVRRFRASGRFAIAHADSFGELGPGNEAYYLATAFDEIDLQPVGLVGLTGLMAEVPLARELLASLGVELEVVKREEYKTALESFTRSELSPANREMLEGLLDGLQRQLVAGIAEGRKLDPVEVQRLIDHGPFTADEALANRLIDRIAHADEAMRAARERAGPGAGRVDLADYAAQRPTVEAGAAKIALIRAAGLIRRGEDGVGFEIAAGDLAEALADAAGDDRIRAVILRIDSGGGSAVASETVARGVRRVREAGKPVIVSMGNTAASGGYWIAMDATRIVAQPGTITGSIGVIAGKPILSGVWDKIGVNWAEIARGAHAGMWSVNQPFSPEARARVEAVLDSIYGTFKAGVARGRSMTPEQVEAVAKGRVWIGVQAKDLGLVDELGGLDAALAAARRELHLPDGAALDIEILPRPRNPLLAALRWLRPQAGALAQAAALVRQLGAATGTATLPPLGVH